MVNSKAVVIIARDTGEMKALKSGLAILGFAPELISHAEQASEAVAQTSAQAVLLEWALFPDAEEIRRVLGGLRATGSAPVIALVSREQVAGYDPRLGLDDFVIGPYQADEVAARIRQARWRKEGADGGDVLKVGDLVIDPARYSVALEGRPISLTYTEYQLLKFLAGHKGQAFTREALLNQVWGYDYFGGDRTVDVHVTRLRDKIEDSNHTFIETVRGVGYRFKEMGG
ncbi:MAG: response regulator transcription factor [Dehalococcoidia bacterium]|nr:response regulator transcription factor [Dehalococcoidia bacterium]